MRHLKWLIPVVIVGLVGAWLYSCAQHVEIPRQMRLADCTNSTLRFHVRVPKGAGFHLVLATPENLCMTLNPTNRPSYPFSGRIRISDASTSTVEIAISSDRSREWNWLQTQGI